MKRRLFLGLIPFAGVATWVWWSSQPFGEEANLITDPDGEEFVYRDGWIVRN